MYCEGGQMSGGLYSNVKEGRKGDQRSKGDKAKRWQRSVYYRGHV
jgi:hypothetical protein